MIHGQRRSPSLHRRNSPSIEPVGDSTLASSVVEVLVTTPSDALAVQADPAFALNSSDPDAVRSEAAVILVTREWVCAQEFQLNVSSPVSVYATPP